MIKINKKIEFKIAADGSSASGKTTGCELIAKKFNMKFLSSGKLYRYCALEVMKNKNLYNTRFINSVAKTITLKKLKNTIQNRVIGWWMAHYPIPAMASQGRPWS